MRKNSFSKEFRLLNATDFEYLQKASSVLTCHGIRFYFKPTRLESKNTRIGISVSGKVGKSHLRNRFKRLIREIYRCSSFKNLGLDILIVVGPPFYRSKGDETSELKIKQALQELFIKLCR